MLSWGAVARGGRMGQHAVTPSQFVRRKGKLAFNLQLKQARNVLLGCRRQGQSPQRHAPGAQGAKDAGPRLPRIMFEERLKAKGQLLFAGRGEASVGQALEGQLDPLVAFKKREGGLANLQVKSRWVEELEAFHKSSSRY